MVHSLYNLLYTPLFVSLLSIILDEEVFTEVLHSRRGLCYQKTTFGVPTPLTIFNYYQLILAAWGKLGFIEIWYRISDDGGDFFNQKVP